MTYYGIWNISSERKWVFHEKNYINGDYMHNNNTKIYQVIFFLFEKTICAYVCVCVYVNVQQFASDT